MSSRREFLTKDLFQVISEIKSIWSEEENEKRADQAKYFSSFASCYAFLAEVPLEDLQNKARGLGLEVEGKAKYQLAKEIFTKEG